ncbi:hypothetical protein, unlikely [Trypanosoma brucei gambiense DAL972]|uniref:Uncharacterized protein n=1 Tax=Trypanosoma brucei gambiense (strain MHOM/CI/86/DAL972) TaxID=679716 RepID=C9ZRN9_TRYB9|nr:hypothetical protein, unlikely [Trypanosoma brucei gambiense DAL972]CBH12025.1 hypothetical protein, unlikely [Trypanosoma brucei gambiense DAL972]|eukprot:XP_011774308.1 hypothetical protein, unlikely [Trypanosoma brucei gambiense DAL972]
MLQQHLSNLTSPTALSRFSKSKKGRASHAAAPGIHSSLRESTLNIANVAALVERQVCPPYSPQDKKGDMTSNTTIGYLQWYRCKHDKLNFRSNIRPSEGASPHQMVGSGRCLKASYCAGVLCVAPFLAL